MMNDIGNEEYFRRAMIYWEYKRIEGYLFWRMCYQFGKTYALKHYNY